MDPLSGIPVTRYDSGVKGVAVLRDGMFCFSLLRVVSTVRQAFFNLQVSLRLFLYIVVYNKEGYPPRLSRSKE